MTKAYTQRLAALATTVVLMGSGEAFAAAVDFRNVSSNIVNSSSTLPNLISTVAYIGGIGLGLAGVFKLKQHVDNPGQHPMKDGLVRLGAGGGLLALPFLATVMTGTVQGADTASLTASQVGFSAATFP